MPASNANTFGLASSSSPPASTSAAAAGADDDDAPSTGRRSRSKRAISKAATKARLSPASDDDFKLDEEDSGSEYHDEDDSDEGPKAKGKQQAPRASLALALPDYFSLMF